MEISTGSYADNVVTFQRNMTSTAAGNLDGSSVMNVVSANFRAYNLNFKNTYGAGTQAVAVTANGNQQGYYGVGLYGYQDTLYAKGGAQYYSNCYVEGAVDYIFGGAAAWFGECTSEFFHTQFIPYLCLRRVRLMNGDTPPEIQSRAMGAGRSPPTREQLTIPPGT